MKLFSNDAEGTFLRRPNRFTAIVEIEGKAVPCHCADPGKLRELLLPGVGVILERSRAPGRKTSWTLAAARYRDEVVPLISSRANLAASSFILPKLFPEARLVRPEFPLGDSRFDFLVEDSSGRGHLLEVKACSLVEYGTALFPDSPSERALKHLTRLGEISGHAYESHFLFIITHGKPAVFRPNLHAQPAFARLLSANAATVRVHASAFSTSETGEAVLTALEVPVDLSHGSLAEADSGSYLIVLSLAKAQTVEVGALGFRAFAAGYYVYAGSAAKNLSSRMARHLRKVRKKLHWHLDYLRPHASSCYALPLASYRNLECELAEALLTIGGIAVPDFGSSDCGCLSHLYFFSGNPLASREFLDLLARFRHLEAFLF